MPTLIANKTQPNASSPLPGSMMSSYSPPPPTTLMLSCNGIQFYLIPTDPSSQVSFKTTAQGVIVLDLENFSGSLQVSSPNRPPSSLLPHHTQPVMTSSSSSFSSSVVPPPRKVEQEPNSPEMASPSSLISVPPGQQKLDFHQKHQRKATDKSQNNSKPKKRTMSDTTTKKVVIKKTKKEQQQEQQQLLLQQQQEQMSLLAQSSMEIPTQQGMDLSQSMPSSFSSSEGLLPLQPPLPPPQQQHPIMMMDESTVGMDSKKEPSETVQQILDRVNSTNSVVGDDDHEAEEDVQEPKTQNDNEDVVMDEKDISPPAATTTEAIPLNLSHSYPPPCPRWGHTMTTLKNDRLLVYGGQSFDGTGKSIILSDVHVYDPKKKSWEKPINCRGEARQWHSVTFLPERQLLLAFGGETYDVYGTKKEKVVTSDSLKVLDTEIMLWYPPAVSGDVPTGRSGHTATLLPSTNEVVLFGGVKGSKWLNTVTILDSVRWIWSVPKIQGAAPKPRSYHTTTAVKSGDGYKLVVFGGNNMTSAFNTVHVLEPVGEGEWKWSHPATQGQAPFPRTGHSAILLEDGKTICIYGGWDPNEEGEQEGEENIFKTSFVLDTETWTWNKGPKAVPGGSGTDHPLEDCGPKRCGHTATVHPETGDVLLFGGRIPGEILAGDFQRLSPSDK